MARNIELLKKVREHIVKNPDQLDMSLWVGAPVDEVGFLDKGETAKVSCGTTACVAGWAVQLNGDKLLVNGFHRGMGLSEEVYFIHQSVAKNGHAYEIQTRAQKLLGLTPEEADVLFMCTEEEAVPYLDQLIAGEQISYPYDDDYDDYDDDDDDTPF